MVPVAGVVFGLVAMVALGYATRWGEALGKLGSIWFWVGLLIFLALGMVVVVLWVIPRYREKRFITVLQAEDSKTLGQDAAESRRQLHNKLLAAIQTLESSPDLRKKTGLPLYALPWYLLLGARQSGKTAILKGVANSFSPFVRPPLGISGPTQDCDWWFFNTAIILDTSGRYAFPAQVELDSGQWHRLLQLLRHYRERQPINGIIIAVAAAGLGTKREEALRVEAAELRQRLDEAIRELGIHFPVYLLITQCDAIEGFTEFFGCFSAQTQRQMLGFLNAQRPQVGDSQLHAAPVASFEALFTSMVERLQQLRLSLLQEKPPTGTLRQRVFCFPEEFRALQQPLRTFVEVLFGENPSQHVPFFRGLFFCSAQQQGVLVSFLRHELHFEDQSRPLPREIKNYFLHDLFTVILPRDQGLVLRTRTASQVTRHHGLLGFAGCVALWQRLLAFFRSGQAAWTAPRERRRQLEMFRK